MNNNSQINKDSYNLVAQNYAQDHGSSLVWREELDKFISLVKDSKLLLDLGCGAGDETIYLSQKLKNSKIIGIDFSESMIEIANSRSSNVEFKTADLVTFNPQEEVQAIWARASLHHLTDDQLDDLFINIAGYSPQGLILCMINKFGNIEEIEEKQKYGTLLKRYFNYFDENKVKNLASKFNYEIIDQYRKPEGEHIFLVSFLRRF